MKKLCVILLLFFCTIGFSITFYSDWGWGYYFWLFGPVGPNASEGMAAAGYSTLEYRGFTQFSIGGYPGPGTEINSLLLRLRNNTGGTGLQIDVNRVTSATPDWDECGGTAPVYLSDHPVQPNAEEYTYFDLTGTAAKADFLTAWEGGAPWFGFGFKGSRGSGEPCMHFFYAFWADQMYDAALFVDYTIGVKEDERRIPERDEIAFQIYPNPAFRNQSIFLTIEGLESQRDMVLRIFNTSGQVIKTFTIHNSGSQVVKWHGDDHYGKKVSCGIYFVQLIEYTHGRSRQLIHSRKLLIIE